MPAVTVAECAFRRFVPVLRLGGVLYTSTLLRLRLAETIQAEAAWEAPEALAPLENQVPFGGSPPV